MQITDYYKTFAIHTLGCKVNNYESEAIANELRSIGLLEVDFNTKADIYVINTCSVTNVADAKSRNMIARARNKNEHAIVIVAGCYSQIASEEIKNKIKVDIVIGNKYKNNITKLIEEYIKTKTTIVKIDNLLLEKEFEEINLNNYESKTRAFIKIQDGCNFMCSYCSIPFTRGKQRSASLTKLIDDIQKFIENGFKEIVLTGVNTAGYLDENNNDFFKLLQAINMIKGDFRVRISSLEPFQITDDLINLITSNPTRFCAHWHICLQSGCDKTLQSMNRKYSTAEFLKLINKIRQKNPLVSISTDVIAGFPNETIQDFHTSYEFIKNINFSFLHVFPYSKRNLTAAAKLKSIMTSKEKTDRVKALIDLSDKMYKTYIKQFKNKIISVLFEKYENGVLFGKSSEYIDIHLKCTDANLVNKIINLKVTDVIGDHLVCTIKS